MSVDTHNAPAQPVATVPATHRTHLRNRTTVMIGTATAAAALAVVAGAQLGHRLTGTPAVAPISEVGPAVIYPSDWQVYRAGERGDVLPMTLPRDWRTYRAGER